MTLMECEILPQITHTSLPDLFQRHRSDLDALMRQHSNSHMVHPGLTTFDRDSIAAIEHIPGTLHLHSCPSQ